MVSMIPQANPIWPDRRRDDDGEYKNHSTYPLCMFGPELGRLAYPSS